MKLWGFVSRLQELNAYFKEFPPDAPRKEIEPLFKDEVMCIIYHSIPTTWKTKMIEQWFNYVNSTVKEMTVFFKLG